MNKNLSKVILASLLGGSLVGNTLYVNTALAADANDQIKIVDSSVSGDQIAGKADEHPTDLISANNNTLIITGNGKVTDGEIYGGKAVIGDANGNKLIIEPGGTASGGSIYGGGVSGEGNANNNSITITGSTIPTSLYGHAIYGGFTYRNGNVNYNSIIIKDSNIGLTIYGGNNNYDGDANYNDINISNSEIATDVIGGYIENDGKANSNKITINGGSIGGDVYGGSINNSGDANGNIVSITGSEVEGDVYGGYTKSGNAIGNTVTIIGDVRFANTSGLYGGYDADSNGGDAFSGNTLNIASAGLSLGNVANFENYNFYLTDANINNAAAVLNLQASSNTNLDKAKINATLSGAARTLKVGDTVKLLHNSNGFDTNDITTGTTLQQGFSLIYGVELDTTSTDSVGLKVTEGGRATEASKSPSETRLATVGFLNSGIDNFTDKGIANAVAVASSDNGAVFAAADGGQSRLHSGSYTDIKGYNFALGAAKAITNNAGKLTYGPFAEAGWGTYDSHLDCGVRGDGNTRYYGVGAFARQDNNSGTYYEGSLRYGQTNSDYSGSGLTDGLGNNLTATYDSSSAYYGAHIGIGKVSKLTDTTSADVYAKLLYTHQQGDSAVMAGSGETYDFDAVDSTRARVGARLSKDYSTRATAYVGTAYEYEFDGEATATVKGFSTLAPSIKGGSGMLELGYSLNPKAANDPTIDLSLQGWLGKKEGFTTNVNFMWKF